MKKVLVTFFLLMTLFMSQSLMSVEASSGTATLKGFDVDGWTYYDDTYENAYSIYDDHDRYYGFIDMWSASYYIYNAQEDVMYYAILVESTTYTNTSITFWNSYSTYLHQITFSISDYDFVEIVSYIPQQSTGSYYVSYSISTASIGFQLDDEYDEIQLYITQYASGSGARFDYNFTRYADNVNDSPYKGTYNQKTVLFLEVEDYSQVFYQADLSISIYYYGGIFRDGFLTGDEYRGGLLGEEYTLEPFGIF